MRMLKCSFICLIACCSLLCSCQAMSVWIKYSSDPQPPLTGGIASLPALEAQVEVLRDQWAIPHIFAENKTDLMRATGYVHAQDRLFQMDMLRRLTTGYLAEVIGDRPLDTPLAYGARTILEQDKGMRILGFGHIARLYLELTSPQTRELLNAYAEGVNAYIESHLDQLPVEFGLLGYRPRAWTPADSVSLQFMLGWGLATNGRVEAMRAAADKIMGSEKSEKVLPIFDYANNVYILPDYQFPLSEPSVAHDPSPLAPLDAGDLALPTLYRLLGRQSAENTEASNNWVVAGSRSESGKPILSNDPHLSHMSPGIFHLMHLKAGDLDVIGASLPGLPLVVLGHNRHTAWAATNNQGDMQDLYLHKVDAEKPDCYRYLDGCEAFVTRRESITVKTDRGFRVESLQVRTTRFGPVISDLFGSDPSKEVISIRWTGQDFLDSPAAYWELERATDAAGRLEVSQKYRTEGRGDSMKAYLAVNLSSSCEDYYKAMKSYGMPRQNWICADTAGHIGYAAAGLMPVRKNGDGRRIARAWMDEGRWIAWIPYDEIPRRMDPESGYIVSANNATFKNGSYPYPWSGHYNMGHRARRIVELVTSKPQLNVTDMQKIQTDVYSKLADDFILLFVEFGIMDPSLEKAIALLSDWDKSAAFNSSGAAMFYTAMSELVRVILLDDLGEDLFSAYVETHLTNGMPLAIALDPNSPFHDDIRTSTGETQADSFNTALANAYDNLEKWLGKDQYKWRWGKLHTLNMKHPLGSEKLIAEALNIGPIQHGGGTDTIWAAFFYMGQNRFSTLGGPVLRHIVDMNQPERSLLVTDSGQWGKPLTEHYDSMFNLWRKGQMAEGLMNREDIEAVLSGKLVLRAAPVAND